MPTLAQLRALVGVVDHASFTDAAAALGVSQSGVSHAIATLEKEAGGRLVERAAPVRPTGLGERLLPHARAALASVDAFAAESAARRLVGTVRLAAVPTVCQGLMPALLHRWSRDLPDVRVQVFEGADDELAPWLEQGTVDAAVLVDPSPAPPGSRLVARDDFRALVRRDHPLADEDGIDLADLHDDGLLVSAGGCEPQVRQMHAAAGLEFRVAQRVHELATMIRMVAEGIGVSVMPALGGTMLPRELVMRPLRPALVRELVLTGPQHRPWHPLVRALIDATDEAPVDATHRPAPATDAHRDAPAA